MTKKQRNALNLASSARTLSTSSSSSSAISSGGKEKNYVFYQAGENRRSDARDGRTNRHTRTYFKNILGRLAEMERGKCCFRSLKMCRRRDARSFNKPGWRSSTTTRYIGDLMR